MGYAIFILYIYGDSKNTADVPSVKTTRYDLKSFHYFLTELWKELPNHIRLEQNLNQFSKSCVFVSKGIIMFF
jgi:hypothetical protein